MSSIRKIKVNNNFRKVTYTDLCTTESNKTINPLYYVITTLFFYVTKLDFPISFEKNS